MLTTEQFVAVLCHGDTGDPQVAEACCAIATSNDLSAAIADFVVAYLAERDAATRRATVESYSQYVCWWCGQHAVGFPNVGPAEPDEIGSGWHHKRSWREPDGSLNYTAVACTAGVSRAWLALSQKEEAS